MIISQNPPEPDKNDYESRMKKTGNTIDDLKFEFGVAHSQHTTYSNAILIVIGLTIAITPLIISNMGPFCPAFTSATICLLSTSVGCIIGVAYCIYDIIWRHKQIDSVMEKYSLFSEHEISDEKMKFNYFRLMYISNLQIATETALASIAFCLCIFLFGVGFTLLVVDSIYTLYPFFTLSFLLAFFVIISYYLLSRLNKKTYTTIYNNSKRNFDAMSNIFYEEVFKNYGDVIKFMVLISQKKNK